MKISAAQDAMHRGLEALRFYLKSVGKPANPVTQQDLCDLLIDLKHTCNRLPDMNFKHAEEVAEAVFNRERK